MAEGVSGGSGFGALFQTTLSIVTGALRKRKAFGRFKNVDSVPPNASVRTQRNLFSRTVPVIKVHSRSTRRATPDKVSSIRVKQPSTAASNVQSLPVNLLTLKLQQDLQAASLAQVSLLKESIKGEIRAACTKTSSSPLKLLNQPQNAGLKKKFVAAIRHEKEARVKLANTNVLIQQLEAKIQQSVQRENEVSEIELQRLLREE